MFKVLNWMFFGGTLLKSTAVALKSVAPAFKELKDANAKEKFINELDKASGVETLKEVK